MVHIYASIKTIEVFLNLLHKFMIKFIKIIERSVEMDYISIFSFSLTVLVCIKINKGLTAFQAIVCAVLIYLLAHKAVFLVDSCFNSISTDTVLVHSLIDVFRPYTIDSVWEAAIPEIIGLLIIAIANVVINKFKQYISY